MTRKLPRQRKQLATGYWGTPWRRIELEQTAAKVRVWLQDKQIARGRFVELYLPVSATTPGVVQCTCVKNTTDSADRSCLSCYGAKFCPGFLKFLRSTIFFCSAEASVFTLTNCAVSTTKKANIITVNDGSLSGVVETTDKAYINTTPVENWEVKLEAYKRATGTTFILEFSTDSGGTWLPIALTEVVGGTGFVGSIPGASLPGTGLIRFRVTMTRVSLNDLPPAFEIVRTRRLMTENLAPQIRRRREDYVPGSILVLRPWTQEQDTLDPGRGRLIEHVSDRSWTMPLDFFDLSLTHDTPACRIDDTFGPHPFYQYSAGVQMGTRYVLTKMNYNEQFNSVFTHQFFDDRRAQQGEHYELVF